MLFTAQQNQPYEVKVRRAELRAIEFVEKLYDLDMEAHVSVGGLDSITLLVFLRKIGIDVPAISVSSLEDKSIQAVHKELGVIPVRPLKSKVEIINEFGFPVISKRIAGKIDMLQNPSDKNKTVRHAIITGECGERGYFAKNSRMKLPQKWLELFGGYENENEKRRAGTKLQQSRRTRQQEKDEVKRLELIVKFFDEPNPKNTLNKMRQLLGKQRKEEEYLNGERHYNNRIEE